MTCSLMRLVWFIMRHLRFLHLESRILRLAPRTREQKLTHRACSWMQFELNASMWLSSRKEMPYRLMILENEGKRHALRSHLDGITRSKHCCLMSE